MSKHICAHELLDSTLCDEKIFYQLFLKDLSMCKSEVIIESPYITRNRIEVFYPLFEKLLRKRVKIYIVTRDPKTHDSKTMREEAEETIKYFERVGIQALLCIGNPHRKVAILDRRILWEGSLNILSQVYSREVMRRTASQQIAMQMFDFLKIGKYL